MVQVTVVRGRTPAGWWTNAGEGLLVAAPEGVSDVGLEALQMTWSRVIAEGGFELIGSDPCVSYVVCPAATAVVEMCVGEGRIVGTLHPDHFTVGAAEALTGVVAGMYRSPSPLVA